MITIETDGRMRKEERTERTGWIGKFPLLKKGVYGHQRFVHGYGMDSNWKEERSCYSPSMPSQVTHPSHRPNSYTSDISFAFLFSCVLNMLGGGRMNLVPAPVSRQGQ